MNTFKRNILLLLLLGVAIPTTMAQNLITNGGFETYNSRTNRFEGWNISSEYAFAKSSDAHSGSNALLIYPQGVFVRTLCSGNFHCTPVDGGSKYTFSFWHKGSSGSERFTAIISWHDSTGNRIRNENIPLQTASTSWQEFTQEVTAPSTATFVALGVNIRSNGDALLLDDISFIFKSAGANTLQPPQGIRTTIFQREIALQWDAENDPQIQWDIIVNNGTPIRVTKNSHTLTKLSPNTNYRIKLRSVKGSQSSSYSNEISVTTASMSLPLTSSGRIPHLRTIQPYGRCPRTIDLYYNDLAETNAEITYWIDGVQTSPNGDKLSFPKVGNQKLKIRIKEASDRIWTLQYQLNVE